MELDSGGVISPAWEGGITLENSADSMLGDLDCNDNTPVLQPQISTSGSTSQPYLYNVMSPSKSCASNCSSVSHPSSLSPEDAVNNDFFYDDEFSVPFDATLTEQTQEEADGEEGDMLDSVDISSLLSLGRLYPNDNRDGMRRRGITNSKSDTCLYQYDLEFSTSDRTNSFGEQSMSENDYVSSSELSDLKNEPLFSPPPNFDQDETEIIGISTDSLGIKGESPDVLSNSFMTDEERYSYDWSANKDRYMLSFDRSPTKYSDEDMDCHESNSTMTDTQECFNSWTSSNHLSKDFNQYSTSTSLKMSGSLSAMKSTGVCRKTTFGELSATKNKKLTTWQKVKRGKNGQGDMSGLTTWKAVKEAQHMVNMNRVDDLKSKSMSDLLPGVINTSLSQTANVSGEQMISKPVVLRNMKTSSKNVIDNKQDTDEKKRHSTSLFEIFQHMKKVPEDINLTKDLSSPQSLPFTNFTTWGATQNASARDRNVDGDKQLVSFASLHNSDNNNQPGSGDCSTGILQPFTGDSFENGGASSWLKTLDPNVSGFTLPSSSQGSEKHNSQDNLIDLNDGITLSGTPAAGTSICRLSNPVETDTKKSIKEKENASWIKENTDPLKQAIVVDHSVQTSFIFPVQANPPCQTPSNNNRPANDALADKLGKNITLPNIKEENSTLELKSKGNFGSQRLTRSVFYTNSTLPDLSFLKKPMAQSVSNVCENLVPLLDQSPIFIMPKVQSPDSIEKTSPLSSPKKSSKTNESIQNRVCFDNIEHSEVSPNQDIPRSRSLSITRGTSESSVNTSLNSSSSSGIDPGSFESPQTKLSLVDNIGMAYSEGSSDCASSESSGEKVNRTKHFHLDNNVAMNKWVHCSNLHCRKKELCKNELRSRSQERPSNESNGKQCYLTRGRSDWGRKSKYRSLSCPKETSKTINKSDFRYKSHCSCGCICGSQECDKIDDEHLIRHLYMSQSIPKEQVHHITKPQCHHRECANLSPSHGHGPVCVKKSLQNRAQVYHMDCTCKCGENHSNNLLYGRKKSGHGCIECNQNGLYTEPLRSFNTTTAQYDNAPLKSCLAKKKSTFFKQRSLSEPHDMAIMKYSQEGQTRYQLVAYNSCKEGCGSLPMGMHSREYSSLPFDNSANTFKEQLETKLCKVSLQPVCTHSLCEATKQKQNLPGPTKAPPNSPENNTHSTIQCSCGNAGQEVHKSIDPSVADKDGSEFDSLRNKKSVSFAEKVSYHSPYSSPHQSPKKPNNTLNNAVHVKTKDVLYSQKHYFQGIPVRAVSVEPLDLSHSADSPPPHDFLVSPSNTPPPVIFTESGTVVDISQKRDLVFEVIQATEAILAHFGKTRDPFEKVKLGSSQCSDIGELVLTKLCSALYSMMVDGLYPYTHSLFGKMKNSVWRVVEDSSVSGPSTKIVNEVVREVKGLEYLSTNWLKFNAFILGLLNHKTLDFWLTFIHCQSKLMTKHYNTDSLMRLGNGPLERLFSDMITALQPLAQLPFKLQYSCEFRMLQKRRSKESDGHQEMSRESEIVFNNASPVPDSKFTELKGKSGENSNGLNLTVQEPLVQTPSNFDDKNVGLANRREIQVGSNSSEWKNWAFSALGNMVPLVKSVPYNREELVTTPVKLIKTLVNDMTQGTKSVIPFNSLNTTATKKKKVPTATLR